jgi:outer membrane receptor protein involved in Fe transport
MRKLKFLVAIAIFIGLTGARVHAQGGQMEIPSNGIISGKVVDNQGNSVEYATVSLVTLPDSTVVSGAISDAGGSFKISNLKLGVYVMKIKVLGFETKNIGPIYLMPKGRGKGEGIEQDFGNIALGSSDIKIEDVTIVGERSRVQYKIDKKVINPSQDINSSSGTAVEILQNTPSVNVDIDGNVELRGSGNFTVLIDGKPTVLTGSEALQQIPANMVENIEIITNPSAKFDPEGAAGIINVIMKSKKSLGVTGVVNLSVGTNDKYKGNVALNYKIGKIGLNLGVDYRNEKRYGSGKMESETYDRDSITNLIDTTFYNNYSGNRDMLQDGMGFQAGIDYFINDKNTLSVSGRFFDRNFGSTQESYYHDWTNPSTTDDYYLRRSESGFGGTSYNINLDYNHKFQKPDQKLDFSFTYSNRDGIRKNDQFKYITDASNNIIDQYPELIKDDETGPEDDYRFKLDFVSPVGLSGIIEAGYQGRYEIENENRLYSNFNSTTNIWDIDPIKSNNIKFTDNIQAIYTTYANKIWGFDYKLGLRGEYNNRFLEQLKTGENIEFNKFDLFPSAYITRQINKELQIQLNYSRRINRPNGRQLDPFRDYSDPLNLREGNPKLDPEYVDSYELNFQQQLKKSFISFETFYRHTNNKISDFTSNLGGGVKLRTYENLNNDNSLGVELNANIFLAKWWRLNASGSGFYYSIEGVDNYSNESFNYNFRFDNSFSLKTGTKVQLTGFYMGPSASIQGTRQGMFFSNFAIRQDLLKNKVTLTAQVQDVFGTAGMKMNEDTESFKTNIEFKREARVFTLSLTYRLNNFKQKKSGDRAIEGNDDVEMDMGM